ncbi:MAG: aminotransferase class I/II-fold pyridoxal phosphate-dependent enzyme, partial [Flavobacteriales bacterium]|nr:aminotransferase class I/II-fold pyridoxal phosphate-dependent enzyme [Flavobacteriales bacterium]
NMKIIKINRFKEINKKPKKNSLVVFVNPSTPDGKFYKLKKLFKIWEEQNCTIVIDESFLEFEDLHSIRKEINQSKKLYVIQSFSKFYSCAGVRIGAIFSCEKNIKKLQTPLWNLSSFDTKFLTQRLLDSGFRKQSKTLHKKNKKELIKILEDTKLFDEIFVSDSNFILVKSSKASEIFTQLLKKKILVRSCESFDFLTSSYLRFGVKDMKMHKKLKKALACII